MSYSLFRALSAQALAVHQILAEALLVAEHLPFLADVAVVVGFGWVRHQLSGAVAEAEAGLRQIGSAAEWAAPAADPAVPVLGSWKTVGADLQAVADLAASEVQAVQLADDHPFVAVPFVDDLLEADQLEDELPFEQVGQPEGDHPSADRLADGEIPSELADLAFDWDAQRPELAAHLCESAVGLVPFDEFVEPSDELVAPSEGAVLPSGVAALPSGVAVLPSGVAVLPSEGVDRPSEGVDWPSEDVVPPSGDAQPFVDDPAALPQPRRKACLHYAD